MNQPHNVALKATEPVSVRLILPARPENVALARQVLAGLAEALDIAEGRLADINIAVTEACNNVVIHAYPEDGGTVEVTITSVRDQLVVRVRDEGAGMNPLPTDAEADARSRLGFGFAMMSSLSDQFGMDSGASGTEVRMQFALSDTPAPEGEDLFADARRLGTGAVAAGDIDLTLTPGAPAAPVLGRFLLLLAARARLSIDRMSDLQLVSDALAMHAPRRALDGCFRVASTGSESGLDLRVGPLEPGGGEAIVADATLAGVGSLLHLLSDSVTSEPAVGGSPGAEVLRLELAHAS
jgi:serine/threonine-protein kinase RsbW